MISKQEFEAAYRKFPPSPAEMFFIKHISIHSAHNNLLVIMIIAFLLMAPFITEVILHSVHARGIYKLIPSFSYMFILAFLGIFIYYAWLKKSQRYNKIRKHLGISKQEYRKLIDTHYYNRYLSTEDYVKYNTKNSHNGDMCKTDDEK
jgi:hypothetical protein